MQNMSVIDRVIFNLKSMGGTNEAPKDYKDFKFENGINLISVLSKLEEKQKSSLRKPKNSTGTELLEKRINPYSKDDDSTEFYYLTKKPQLGPVGAPVVNPQAFNTPYFTDFLDYKGDGNDAMRISSAIRIESVMNFLKLKKEEKENAADGEKDDGFLTENDESIIEFLRNDEHILLTVGEQWLSQEIANYSFYTKSHKRYFAILNALLDIIRDPDVMDNLFTIPQYAELLLKFFQQIPLINDNVFLCLKVIIEAIQTKNSEYLDINALLECYQQILDKFNGQTEAIVSGIRYLMDLGLNESIKLIRLKYYPHPSFTNIIEQFMQQDIESLKRPLDQRENENYIKHFRVFAHKDVTYLQKMFEYFPQFNEGARNLLLDEKSQKFIEARFKTLSPEVEIPLIATLFSELDQSNELLEKLATHLKLHLDLFGLAEKDKNRVRDILNGYQNRKRGDFFCSLILKADDSKIDDNIKNLPQGDTIADVFIGLHRAALYPHYKEKTIQIRNIIKDKFLELLPYDRVLRCLDEICRPVYQGQISPLSGLTIVFAYTKFKKPNPNQNPRNPIEIYNDLLDKVEILLQSGALEDKDNKNAILLFLSMVKPWPEKAMDLIKTYIPIKLIEEFEGKTKQTLQDNLAQARKDGLLPYPL